MSNIDEYIEKLKRDQKKYRQFYQENVLYFEQVGKDGTVMAFEVPIYEAMIAAGAISDILGEAIERLRAFQESREVKIEFHE